jgi:ATP-dependent exoDNAse (exonuclease V) beta subunit
MSDQAQRDQALDVTQSYIVQAPAGSGKTELLTQRYLKLLTTCSEPENIIAMTFTNKAVDELTERVLSALDCLTLANFVRSNAPSQFAPDHK